MGLRTPLIPWLFHLICFYSAYKWKNETKQSKTIKLVAIIHKPYETNSKYQEIVTHVLWLLATVDDKRIRRASLLLILNRLTYVCKINKIIAHKLANLEIREFVEISNMVIQLLHS